MKKQKMLTPQEIEAKKAMLKEAIEESKEKAKLGNRISPAKAFLQEIKEIVKDALNNGVSYTQLRKDIKKVYSFDVSEQTIRSFAHNVLGIAKRSMNTKQADQTDKKTETKAKKSASQIKQEMAQNGGDEL